MENKALQVFADAGKPAGAGAKRRVTGRTDNGKIFCTEKQAERETACHTSGGCRMRIKDRVKGNASVILIFLKTVVMPGQKRFCLVHISVDDRIEDLPVLHHGQHPHRIDIPLIVENGQIKEVFDFRILPGNIRVAAALDKRTFEGDGVADIFLIRFRIEVAGLLFQRFLQEFDEVVDAAGSYAELQRTQKHAENGLGDLAQFFVGKAISTSPSRSSMEMASRTGELLTSSSRDMAEMLSRCPGIYFRSMMLSLMIL